MTKHEDASKKEKIDENKNQTEVKLGVEGETVALKCRQVKIGSTILQNVLILNLSFRNRSNLTWTYEPRNGDVESLPNVSRKLRILVGPDTVGIYKCYSGSKLLQSFQLMY